MAIATLAWFLTAVSVWKLRQVVGRRVRKAGFFVSSVGSNALLRRNR